MCRPPRRCVNHIRPDAAVRSWEARAHRGASVWASAGVTEQRRRTPETWPGREPGRRDHEADGMLAPLALSISFASRCPAASLHQSQRLVLPGVAVSQSSARASSCDFLHFLRGGSLLRERQESSASYVASPLSLTDHLPALTCFHPCGSAIACSLHVSLMPKLVAPSDSINLALGV